jgi:protein-S-isoprenylcysteine O-methyltransferase Ste14
MIYFDNYSIGCWMYLALHGSYGISWIIKDMTFPDRAFQAKIKIGSAIILVFLLAAYLLAGYQIASRIADNEPSLQRIIVAFYIYSFGLFLMIGSDLQKYYIMKYRQKNSLIDNGFFKLTRNPNYLGEVMIYYSFAIIVQRWEYWFILWAIHSVVFLSRMLIKDKSLSKKENWDKYDSYMFFPKFSSCPLDNLIIYSVLFGTVFLVYVSGGFYGFFQEVQHIYNTSDFSQMKQNIYTSEIWTVKEGALGVIQYFLNLFQ